MIKSKGANGTTGFLVIVSLEICLVLRGLMRFLQCQVLQGLGGGIAACSSQLLAQGSVRHQDLGTATAFVLLWAAIGVSILSPPSTVYLTRVLQDAVGSALAAAIWRDYMPKQLAQNLNGLLNTTEIDSIYASITTAITYREDTAVYEGIVSFCSLGYRLFTTNTPRSFS